MTVRYGRKILFVGEGALIRSLLPEGFEIIDSAMGYVEVSGSGGPFIVEDAGAEFNLCPIMKRNKDGVTANFSLFISIPKPK